MVGGGNNKGIEEVGRGDSKGMSGVEATDVVVARVEIIDVVGGGRVGGMREGVGMMAAGLRPKRSVGTAGPKMLGLVEGGMESGGVGFSVVAVDGAARFLSITEMGVEVEVVEGRGESGLEEKGVGEVGRGCLRRDWVEGSDGWDSSAGIYSVFFMIDLMRVEGFLHERVKKR